jgi:hypothetical protein
MVIGDKSEFAIEYLKYEVPLSGGRIWVKDLFIGAIEDQIYLNGYLGSFLNQILNAKQIDNSDFFLEKDALFKKLVDSQQHMISSSTFLDDFMVFTFRMDYQLCFLWSCINDEFFPSLKNYPKGVNLKEIPYKSFVNVYNEFNQANGVDEQVYI